MQRSQESIPTNPIGKVLHELRKKEGIVIAGAITIYPDPEKQPQGVTIIHVSGVNGNHADISSQLGATLVNPDQRQLVPFYKLPSEGIFVQFHYTPEEANKAFQPINGANLTAK